LGENQLFCLIKLEINNSAKNLFKLYSGLLKTGGFY